MKKLNLFGLVVFVLVSFAVIQLIEYRGTKQLSGVEINNVETGNKGARAEKNLALEGKRIVLDPGHGGSDVGASGKNTTIEKTVTLEAANKIRDALEQEGAKVKLTRDQDEYVGLEQRVMFAVENKADLFISIHCDAFKESDVYGMTSYYYHHRDQRIAEYIQQHIFMENINTRDRGVAFGDYYVLRENKVPAMLLELGYISNPKDEVRITSDTFQEKVAAGIAQGVIEYFGA